MIGRGTRERDGDKGEMGEGEEQKERIQDPKEGRERRGT